MNLSEVDKDDDVVMVTEAIPLRDDVDEEGGAEETKTTGRVFDVVAPADLPKNYRLTCEVTTANKTKEEVVVLVPHGGVRRMQTFQGREALPATKFWRDSEFDCQPNYEGSFCCLAVVSPPLAWAFIARKLGLNLCGSPSSSSGMSSILPWMMVLVLLLSQTGLRPWAGLYIVYFATVARGAVRKRYNIPGSCFMDCFCTFWCGCCTALQSFRQMKRNGDTPFEVCGEGKVVAIQV